MKKTILIILSVLMSAFIFPQYSPSFAELKITEIQVQGKRTSIVFNDAFKISGIVIQGETVEMPFYISKGKLYRQFSIIDRNFKRYIAQTINKKETTDLKSAVSFKINKMNPVKNHKNIKAFASVIVENVLEIECRVMNADNGLWIAFPSIKQNGKWVKLLTFSDFSLKENMETQLIKSYLQYSA